MPLVIPAKLVVKSATVLPLSTIEGGAAGAGSTGDVEGEIEGGGTEGWSTGSVDVCSWVGSDGSAGGCGVATGTGPGIGAGSSICGGGVTTGPVVGGGSGAAGGAFDAAARNCSINSSGDIFPRAFSHARPIELFRSGDGTSPVFFSELESES